MRKSSNKTILDRIYKRGGIDELEYNELMWRLEQHMPTKKVIKFFKRILIKF